MFAVARFDGGAIGRRHAGVVELVDARDSKSRSARSVGSIPTARTSPLGMIHLRHRTVAGSCPSGVWRPIRAAPRVRRNDNRTALSCWPLESRTGFGHRPHRLREASICALVGRPSATFCDLRAGHCNILGFKRSAQFGCRYKPTAGSIAFERLAIALSIIIGQYRD